MLKLYYVQNGIVVQLLMLVRFLKNYSQILNNKQSKQFKDASDGFSSLIILIDINAIGVSIRHAPSQNFPGSVIPDTEMQGSVIDLLWPIGGLHRI